MYFHYGLLHDKKSTWRKVDDDIKHHMECFVSSAIVLVSFVKSFPKRISVGMINTINLNGFHYFLDEESILS